MSDSTSTAFPNLPALWIDGRFTATARASRTEADVIDVIDPASGLPLARLEAASVTDVDAAVAAATAAFRNEWRDTSPMQRGRVLHRASGLLLERLEEFAAIEARSVGKPLAQARSDVTGAARFLEYYSGIADKLEGETIPLGPDALGWTMLEPAGVVAQIVPWNSPLNMLMRGVAPALAAGCTIVAKPAEQTPHSALLCGELFESAGLPDGAYNVVAGRGGAVGQALAGHSGVAHVTFTGSVTTGKAVMAEAARHLASVTLELGGKSPLLILEDADDDTAIAGAATGIFANAGQICAAASRLILLPANADRVLAGLVKRAETIRLGPWNEDADMGPVVSRAQFDKLNEMISRAVDDPDVTCHCGGGPADGAPGNGFYFRPTILETADPDHEIVQTELFGPVQVVQRATDFDHAIELANCTDYGLVAGIYGKDIAKIMRFSREAECGQVYVNRYFGGGVETPVGGVKSSGIGREKGLRGLEAYLRPKCVTSYF